MDILQLCMDYGATKAEEIPVSKIVLQPELRKYCEVNSCGLYGKNYTCPPHVGEVDDLINNLRKYNRAFIWQNIYPLEDSFDFEGMMDGGKHHQEMTLKIANEIYAKLGKDDVLILSAGGCSKCKSCGIKTSEPCRHPESALVSLEAYCINVSQIGEVSSLKYINGENTVTYFSGAFLK